MPNEKRENISISPELEQQVGELIASYEVAVERLAAREKALEDNFDTAERFLNEQIDKINALMADLRNIMTEAGAARWRLAAQETLRLGDLQLQSLRKISQDTGQMINDSCQRFERTSTITVKNIHDAIASFKTDDIKQFVEQSYEQIKTVSAATIEKTSQILRWFHWRNMALALGLSLVVAVFIGLYINDEWPWEMHKNVVNERTAGKALMNAWPHLNKQDQDYLEQKILNLSKQDS